MTAAEFSLGGLVLVGVIAFVLKMASKSETPGEGTGTERPASAEVDALLADMPGIATEEADVEEDDGSETEIVAITSDGWAFLPDGDEVYLVPPGDSGDMPAAAKETGLSIPVNPRTGRDLREWRPGEHLDAGDLTGVRVVRGAPDFDPWRLEAVGRDGEYRAWPFETEDAANAARELLDRRIVRPPLDEDGEPAPLSPSAFDEARRVDEETEKALDAEDES